MKEKVVPYKESEDNKKQQVAKMFNDISGTYDFLNHFLSLGIDITWRNKVIAILKKQQPGSILDVATGTADLAIMESMLKPQRIVGVDIAEGMLEVGRKKVRQKGLEDIIELHYGDSENLQFDDNTFDAVTVAFGVRNFENLDKGLKEMNRVLRNDGKVIILEFSHPEVFPFKQLYSFYFLNVLPLLGKIFSKDNSAYTYLPESVRNFPSGNTFLKHLEKNGFKNTECRKLSLGICSIYTGIKH